MRFVQTIDTTAITLLDQPIAPEKIVTGAPMTGTRTGLEQEKKGFYTGVWASSRGSWRMSYTEDELCVLLEGHIRLTGDDGLVVEYRAGDAFTIAAGFAGIWETLEPVRKVYAIAI